MTFILGFGPPSLIKGHEHVVEIVGVVCFFGLVLVLLMGIPFLKRRPLLDDPSPSVAKAAQEALNSIKLECDLDENEDSRTNGSQ